MIRSIAKLTAIAAILGILYMEFEICVWYGEYKVIKSPDLYYAGVTHPAGSDI